MSGDEGKFTGGSPTGSSEVHLHSESFHRWFDRVSFFHSYSRDQDESQTHTHGSAGPGPLAHRESDPDHQNGTPREIFSEGRTLPQEESELDIDEEFWKSYRARKNKWNRIPVRRRHPR